MLSEDWQTLDDIAKRSDNSTKKKLNTEVGKCKSVVCCETKYDVNISWVMHTTCRSWVHYLCEGIPNTSFGDDAVYECLSCRSFIPETLEGYFVAKLQENRDRQFELETQILPKKVNVRHKKSLLPPILVTVSTNYWKLWTALRLFARLIMGMSLLATTVKLF